MIKCKTLNELHSSAMTAWAMNFHSFLEQLVMVDDSVHYAHGQNSVVAVKYHAMIYLYWRECSHRQVSFSF